MHRSVDIVVPFRLDGAKSRLSPSLDPDERRKFALAMLRDVLASVRKFGEVTILTRSGSEGSNGGASLGEQDQPGAGLQRHTAQHEIPTHLL